MRFDTPANVDYEIFSRRDENDLRKKKYKIDLVHRNGK